MFITKKDAFIYRSFNLRTIIIFITVFSKGLSTNSQIVSYKILQGYQIFKPFELSVSNK